MRQEEAIRLPVNQGDVLVVDDDPSVRQYYRRSLEPLGYSVREAGDGASGLRELARALPDAVLLDVQMPGMDGFSVCRKMKAEPRTRLVPVVIVTSLDSLDDRVRAAESGADDYLTKPFFLPELVARVRSLVSLKRYTDEMEHTSQVLEGFALAVERRDSYTMNHSRRLGNYAVKVGAALGLPCSDLETLKIGGLLHDVGKIGVPDAILLKPGRLTPEEYEIVKGHSAAGADLCRPLRTLARALPLIRHHHEKLDGSGYPDGLRGAEIPLPVRILSVVDVYDALASKRCYKDSFLKEKCFAILREESARGWWDRDVVETLISILEDPETRRHEVQTLSGGHDPLTVRSISHE